MRWPSKEFATARARQIVYNEDNLVVGYNMKPRANALIDVSLFANDGTIVGTPSVEKTILGDSMYFDGVGDYINCGTPYALTDLTMSMWIRPSSIAPAFVWDYYLSATDAWGIRFNLNSIHIYDDIDNAGTDRYSTAVGVNQVYHVVAVMSSLENLLYINGVLVGSGESSSAAWSSFAGTLYLGSRNSTGNYYNGRIIAPKLYSEAKNAAWVAEQYALGANAVQGKTDWGAQESVAAEATAGDFLSNTPFRIGSGSWRVSMDTIESRLSKVIECVSPGYIYIPTTLIKGSPTEDAFGTFDWWLYKPTGVNTRFVFIAESAEDWNNAAQNGFGVRWSNVERINLNRITGGVEVTKFFTVSGWLAGDQWARFRITVADDSEFTGYVNNQLIVVAGGTNPATDNTYTASSYVVASFSAGCKLAYSDQVGDHCFFKKLGVVAP